MSKFDYEGMTEALLVRVGGVRAQLLGFIRDLDVAGVVPGFMPEGSVEALAEADAALGQLQERLASGEAGVAEIDEAERRMDTVEEHIREIQQDLWRAAVKLRAR